MMQEAKLLATFLAQRSAGATLNWSLAPQRLKHLGAVHVRRPYASAKAQQMADLHVDWQMHFWAEYLWMASVHCRQERNSGATGGYG